uniref:Uncharacterized protein n=1 Tax=Magallana gigas TaxID=29159 RepID=K1PJK0_MAGGI
MYKIKPYPEQGGVLLFLSLGIIFVKDSWVILSRFSGKIPDFLIGKSRKQIQIYFRGRFPYSSFSLQSVLIDKRLQMKHFSSLCIILIFAGSGAQWR